MTLQEFHARLASHDWHYAYSDSGYVFRRGSAEASVLREASKLSPEHEALYKAWHTHVYSGKPWGTEQAPRPEMPA